MGRVAEPLRVRFREERQALALAEELEGRAAFEVTRRDSHAWEVSIDDLQTKRFLVSTLDAVRRTLSGQPSATAEVLVNGDTYQMRGE
jgi:hypothetical protein